MTTDYAALALSDERTEMDERPSVIAIGSAVP
jgi:hypothetical protein